MERFQRDGLTFDVRDAGPADGEPVVLLHGFPQDKDCWLGVETHLHAAGLRTLAPDQRGYSPGARPKARRAYTTAELSADIVALLDAAGLDSAHVVGHDWGAAVAWALAGNHASRVRSATILSVPHPVAMGKAALRSKQGLKSWYIGAFQLPWLPERVLGSPRVAGGLRKSGLAPQVAERYAARLREPGAARGMVNWYRGLPFSGGEPIHRAAVPTTYVWSRGDAFLDRAPAEATAKYVKADYRFVELDGDHWLPDNQPETIAGLIVERARG